MFRSQYYNDNKLVDSSVYCHMNYLKYILFNILHLYASVYFDLILMCLFFSKYSYNIAVYYSVDRLDTIYWLFHP